MAIQSNFPAIKPTLLLDFANTEQLDPRITFTRASTATYYGMQTAKAEENLLLQSQTLNSASWSTTNSTVTGNTTTAPDGTTTAETVTDDTAAQAHVCAQVVTTTAGLVHTLSFFLKASTNNFAVVTLSSTTTQNYISAVVNLSTGAITETSTGTSATFTSSSITSVGSGWYRVVITGSCTAGFTRAEMGLAPAATGNSFATNGRVTYTGTGTAVFVWGAQLEQRSAATAYTATTTASITNYIPQLLTAASGVARFDHNPTTFESLGLLIEESRTNLLLRSDDFTATWNTAATSSVGSNVSIAPDGTQTGDKLIEAANTGQHYILQSATVSSATSYTATVYAKAGERQSIALRLIGSATYGQAFFNLLTGTVTQSAGTGAITSVGNGWYRCSITGTSDSTSTGVYINIGQTATSTSISSYTGDGYAGLFLWGAQLEAGAFATSYIPTVASQVTRAADAASMTGTNFSSWYNAGQGTLYAEANTYSVSTGNRTSFAINDATLANRISVSHGSTKATVVNGGTTQMSQSIASVVFTDNTFSKVSVAYADNNGNASANGTLGTLDTAMTIPVVTQLQIGTQVGLAVPVLNGTIKKLAYYPIRCADAQLQALTG